MYHFSQAFPNCADQSIEFIRPTITPLASRIPLAGRLSDTCASTTRQAIHHSPQFSMCNRSQGLQHRHLACKTTGNLARPYPLRSGRLLKDRQGRVGVSGYVTRCLGVQGVKGRIGSVTNSRRAECPCPQLVRRRRKSSQPVLNYDIQYQDA
ncbi:hypothetical protein HYDPIDRAFT_107898 [Hydnomerulius pinastri MD-312]|nr:hypothetical protein HYDPIDRAFT_107898 [Hydnomerulius pinastri MD-312]